MEEIPESEIIGESQKSQAHDEIKDKPKFWLTNKFKLFLVALLLLLSIASISTIYSNYNLNKDSKSNFTNIKLPPNPTYTPTPTPAPLKAGRIAYIKNHDLFILDNKGNRQITTGNNTSFYNWSKDGKYLGWITEKDSIGISLTLLNLTTNEKKTIISQKYSIKEMFDRGEDPNFSPSLISFDLSPDSSKIVYIREGVWLRDVASGKEELIAKDYIDPEDITKNESYGNVKWNPTTSKILLLYGAWECSGARYYDLDQKVIESPKLTKCSTYDWSPDGKYIVSTSGTGPGLSGLEYFDVLTNKKSVIIGEKIPGQDPSLTADVFSYSISKNGKVIAAIEFLQNSKNHSSDIYIVNSDNTISAISNNFQLTTEGQHVRKMLSWSNDSQYIAYLQTLKYGSPEAVYDMYIGQFDGSDLHKQLSDIESFKFSP